MRYLLLISTIIISGISNAQSTSKFIAFPITDYIVNASDTIQIVQVKLPNDLSIKEKTLGILKSKWQEGDKELQQIGYGRCHLIKGEYYYFGIKMDKNGRIPSAGDLIYTTMDLPKMYDGVLSKVARHYITFSKIDESPLMQLNEVLALTDVVAENKLIDVFIEELAFTGKTMLLQQDNQDMAIESGKYKDQKLFAALQVMKNNDVKDFLEYVIARPTRYAGHDWKFAEVFATWMSEGAPTVSKD